MAVTTDNRAIIEEGYERFAQQDVPGVLALFSPEIVWTIPGPSTVAGEYHGPEGVGEFFGKIAQTWDRLEVRPAEMLVEGDRVVVLGHHKIEVGGSSHDVPFVHTWRLDNGRPVSFEEYLDTARLEGMLAS
jgi:ketosteroid isomerase-like protein